MTRNPYAYASWAVQTAKHWEKAANQFLDDLQVTGDNTNHASRMVELAVRDSLAAKLSWLSALRTILEQCE